MPTVLFTYVGTSTDNFTQGTTYVVLGWLVDGSGNLNGVMQANSTLPALSGNILDPETWTMKQVSILQNTVTLFPVTV